MSIAIKVADGYLDLQPGTQVQRERLSPFFLSKSSGKDGIPGEVSYPFQIPLTEANMAKLGYADFLPAERTRIVDNVVFDDINQITAGKLQLGKTSFNLTRSNVGTIQANLLCNSSAFAKLVEGKKLSDLSLGGDRTFTWDGYNAWTGTGFWKHCHDTWAYADCDDGDYVFYPIANSGYTGYCWFQNALQEIGSGIELYRGNHNVTGLCPHPFLAYVIRKVFEEFGYTVSGDLLEDADFKKLTMASFRGVYWSEIRPITGNDFLAGHPLSSVTLKLSEHVPPNIGIGQFLVELQKFLPIGFDINDNARHCTIRLLGRPSAAAYLKDMTGKVSPGVTIEPGKPEKANNVVGFRRSYNTDQLTGGSTDTKNLKFEVANEIASLPLPGGAVEGQVYRVIDENAYYSKQNIDGTLQTKKIADNTGSYEPAETNVEYIESAASPMQQLYTADLIANGMMVIQNYDLCLPSVEVEGNWYGKPETAESGIHLAFYRGRTFPVDNSGSWLVPYATNTNSRYQVGSGAPELIMSGNWSLAYELSTYGLIDYWWKGWLEVLKEQEKMTGMLNLPLHEYLQLNWADEILIENTSFLLTKLQDILPYTGAVQFEGVRWVK